LRKTVAELGRKLKERNDSILQIEVEVSFISQTHEKVAKVRQTFKSKEEKMRQQFQTQLVEKEKAAKEFQTMLEVWR
jgi:hypothetical protein